MVVARDNDGSIAAFENRCAHRGALICLDDAGKGAKDFQCVYHAWRYDLRGNLQSVAFQRGVKGKGGMPPDFRVEDHGPRQLRVTTLHGLVFGTFSDETPAIEDFIGPEVLARFDRILGGRKIEIIGRFVEVLPNNWKLYAENARDSYHASLLHLFFATFKLNRLSQGGGLVVSPNGGCSVSETLAPTETDDNSLRRDAIRRRGLQAQRHEVDGRRRRASRPRSTPDRHGLPKLCPAEDSKRHGDPLLHAQRLSIARTWSGSISVMPMIRRRCASAG